jgi:tetratricopeptide (TPR) repeat protein
MLSGAELDRMIAPLGRDSADERRAAATALAALGPDATPAITQKLVELRKGGDGGVYSVLKGLRDKGGKEGGDLLETLVQQKPDAATTRALTVMALVRALAHEGTIAATRQLVLLASDASGALRPELGRQMKQLGDRAVAALIEARRDPSTETRTWASALLEAMNKRSPGDAVQTRDNQSLADVLRAYANAKDLEALPVVLSFVGSERALVRTAAREATLTYGQDAVWKLRESYAALTGDQAPEGMPAADLAKKLFDAYDRFRLQEVYALLDAGLAKQNEGKLEEAIPSFDEVLARQPLLDRRSEMVPGYIAWAMTLEDKDRPAAQSYLRRAVRIDEAGPHAHEARAELQALEGEDLVQRGISDTEPFEQALALDPSNARAKTALDHLRAESQTSRSHGWRLTAAALVLVLALGGIAVLGGRRKKPAEA